jgi:hypothetical protein
MVGPDGRITPAWEKWLDILWRKTGAETNVAPISVEGTATGVETIQAAGSPEGAQAAAPGTFYIDTDTDDLYVKKVNTHEYGWIPL